MQNYFIIAKRELKSLMMSPVGWVVIMIFTIHSSLIIGQRLDVLIRLFELLGQTTGSYTSIVFTGFSAYIMSTVFGLYLYLPLLTMGVFSKEYQDGSIKLLFSSPIKTEHIVLGKYLGVMTLLLSYVAVILVYIISIRLFVFDNLDVGLLIGGVVYLFLVIALYVAIGLFISSLTSYQMVAAIGTFTVLFVMNKYLPTIVAHHHPEFLMILFSEWLPISKHFDVLTGLINTGTLSYFFMLIPLFLGFTMMRIHFMRSGYSPTRKAVSYLVLGLVLIGAGVYVFYPQWQHYFDLTDDKRFTPSNEQAYYLNKLTEPLNLTKYTHILENPVEGSVVGWGGRLYTSGSLRRSLRVKTELNHVPYYKHTNRLSVDYSTDGAVYNNSRELARLTPETLSRDTYSLNLEELVSIATEKYSWIKSGEIVGPSGIAEVFDTTKIAFNSQFIVKNKEIRGKLNSGIGFPSDQELTALIKGSIEGFAKIGILSANMERSAFEEGDKNIQRVFTFPVEQYSLFNQGFEILSITSPSDVNTVKMDILVIADPQLNYDEEMMNNIAAYINSGGNLFVLTSLSGHPIVNFIANQVGLKFEPVDEQVRYGNINAEIVISDINKDGILLDRVAKYRQNLGTLLQPDRSGAPIAMYDYAKISSAEINSDFISIPVLIVESDTLITTLRRNVDGVEQRIVLSGSTDILSNTAEGIGFRSSFNDGVYNVPLYLSLFRWLSNDRFPVLVESPSHVSTLIAYNVDKIKLFFTWGLPLMIGMMGSVILIKRYRQ